MGRSTIEASSKGHIFHNGTTKTRHFPLDRIPRAFCHVVECPREFYPNQKVQCRFSPIKVDFSLELACMVQAPTSCCRFAIEKSSLQYEIIIFHICSQFFHGNTAGGRILNLINKSGKGMLILILENSILNLCKGTGVKFA